MSPIFSYYVREGFRFCKTEFRGYIKGLLLSTVTAMIIITVGQTITGTDARLKKFKEQTSFSESVRGERNSSTRYST